MAETDSASNSGRATPLLPDLLLSLPPQHLIDVDLSGWLPADETMFRVLVGVFKKDYCKIGKCLQKKCKEVYAFALKEAANNAELQTEWRKLEEEREAARKSESSSSKRKKITS